VRIVFSRKGFDSSVGGHASPILPDGRMVSLPIPSKLDTLRYADIALRGGGKPGNLQCLMDELGIGQRIGARGAHLDPDLVRSARPRRRGWRAAFGQIGAAAGHLRNQGVGPGDLFLFYGWFRHTRRSHGRLQFVSGPGVHAIFGYLQVGTTIKSQRLPAWLADHPHAAPARRTVPNNTIYIAASRLGHSTLPGSGMFRFHDSLVLTQPGATRSRWRLDPRIFRGLRISYHDDSAWRDGHFQSYRRAQEYVVQANSAASDWAHELITASLAE
jgi:hypothetical protein